MLDSLITRHKPDILDCIANLSNDEVFTPPAVANKMLDLLPAEVWTNPELRFLDPGCKSGVFLREAAKRLMVGLTAAIPDESLRREHIFKNMLHGIAITELTSQISRRTLYYTKDAASEHSVVPMPTADGNIRYQNIAHAFKAGSCIHCGAPEATARDLESFESHAYLFIHEDLDPTMKFDVIIGNPPYQFDDGGHGRSAAPLYHKFVEKAKKLQPQFMSMIIPSRWFVGGKGLEAFRAEMLNDGKIRTLVDYENSSDAFKGVDIAGGVCYFLWDREYEGPCEVINFDGEASFTLTRPLNEFPVLIRNSRAIPIVRKALSYIAEGRRSLSEVVSARKPFGLPTNYEPQSEGVPCWFIQKIGLKFARFDDVKGDHSLLARWKVLVPKAPIAGQTDFTKPVKFYYDGNTRIAKPGECCTESWLVAGSFASEEEARSFRSYLYTKTVRFLLLQAVVSQDVTRQNYCFVPDLGVYSGTYTDAQLCELWAISAAEWALIDAKILEAA